MPDRLVVHHHGPANGPTLLLLHGLTDSGPAWADAIARWQGSYRVLAPDLLGHGESPRFTAAQLAEADPAVHLLDTLVEAADAELDGPVVVVGHSMGGGLAAHLSLQRPDLVRALVLEDPAWRDASVWRERHQLIRERVEGCREAARDLDAEVARGRLDHPAWPEAELRPWAESSAAFDLDFGATGRAALDVPWRDVAAALAVPTLVVTGTEEVIIDPSVRHELTALANDHLEIVVVPGAGHCVRRDQRAGFHEVVDPWIARHAG